MPKPVSGTIGRYHLQQMLDDGGMGAVYLAHDPIFERLTAIKLLREGINGPDVRECFMRVARSAARLHHPNIVLIFEVGEHDGQPFFAMEYIRGKTLADLIERNAALEQIQRLKIIEDVCAALHYGHRSGVVHRNIRPTNVMINEEGIVKILNFGITQKGVLAASALPYRAPEQIKDQEIDARADIFSLGTVLYELLSYRAAFTAVPFSAIIRTPDGDPEPLETLVPNIDLSLVSIVNRCLAKKPADRYPDCLSVATEIAKIRIQLQGSGKYYAPMIALPSASQPPGSGETSTHQFEPLAHYQALQVRSHLERARIALRQKAYEDALQACELALVLDPDQPEAKGLADAIRDIQEPEMCALPPSVSRAEANRRSSNEGRRDVAVPNDENVLGPTPITADAVDGSGVVPIPEELQFTVYKPREITPETWYSVLAFAHLSDLPADARPDDVPPQEQVRNQAERLLGEQIRAYAPLSADALEGVPRGDELRFVLEIEGLEVNPRERAFRWSEDVHCEQFRIRAPMSLKGRSANGSLTVFRGLLVIADLSLRIRIVDVTRTGADRAVAETLRHYRKVFASYSHHDRGIVDAFEQYSCALGDIYLRDVRTLRSGEVWSERLDRMLAESDVFQLFWSNNAMRSDFVRREWERALDLQKPIRPVYWQTPFPEDSVRGLPPPSLRRLHFTHLALEDAAVMRNSDAASSLADERLAAKSMAKCSQPLARKGGWRMMALTVVLALALLALVLFLFLFIRR